MNTKCYDYFTPLMLRVNKKEVCNYSYINTVRAGSSTAHILKSKDYVFCFSSDDNVSVESDTLAPVGFYRPTIEDINDLIKKFDGYLSNKKNQLYISVRKPRQPLVTQPLRLNQSGQWFERMRGKYIVNTNTGETIHLGDVEKNDICKALGINNHYLTEVAIEGKEKFNWCGLQKRTDDMDWDQYFLNKDIIFKDPRIDHSYSKQY